MPKRKRKHLSAGMTALALCLLLAACQSAPQASSVPEPALSADPSPSMSPSPSAEVTPEPEVNEDAAALAGVYSATIHMTDTQSVELYLKIAEDGSFVFARDTAFSSDEKGAGTLGKTAQGEPAFLYTVVNGETVESGTRAAIYSVTDDGRIQFLSPMWFGSTEPKIQAADGTVTHPEFLPYDPSQPSPAPEPSATPEPSPSLIPSPSPTPEPAPQETPASTQQPTASVPVVTPEPEPVSLLQEGTYTGSTNKYIDAMGSNVTYDVTLYVGGGYYDYTVDITLTGGMDYAGQEYSSGTYTIDGDQLYFSGDLSYGTIYGNSITLTGYLSSFASSESSITVFQ